MNKWLIYLCFTVISAIVLILFFVRNQPVDIDALIEARQAEHIQITEPTVSFVNPSKGAENPKVTIVEFGDFGCEACKGISQTLDQILEKYPDEVRVVWKHLPNDSLHPNTTQASIAAQCAHRQHKFWPYHNELYNNRLLFTVGIFDQIATSLELDIEQFGACFNSEETKPVIDKDVDEAFGLQLSATPTLFIGDEILVGQVDFNKIDTIVKQQINQ